MFISVFFPFLTLSSDCQTEWDTILSTQTVTGLTSDYYSMFLSSGFVLNNLGDFYRCNQIDSAKYTIVVMNWSPVLIHTLCGPEICTKEDYYNLTILPFGNNFSYALDVYFPHEYQQDHYESLTSGAI